MKGQSVMPYALRRMTAEDVPQVDEIEREAFPTVWPPTSYRKELKNRLADYAVCVHRDERALFVPQPKAPRFLNKLFNRRETPASAQAETTEKVLGFVGLWFMVEEAHIVTIAVRESYRRQGIGELLMLGAFEMAEHRGYRVLTLEVRFSNVQAQKLYEKYGFQPRGIRRGYYSDNREDALIMTTPMYAPEEFHELLQQHRARFAERYGSVEPLE